MYQDQDSRRKSLVWDFIESNGIATEEELALVTSINGYNMDALNAIIFARTTYHNMEQAIECEPENFYNPEYSEAI